MGLCQNKHFETQLVSSTKAILMPENFKQTSFYFSTQNLLRVDADCLIVFSQEKINFKKNNIFTKTGRMQTKKVQEYAQSYLKNEKIKLKAGQCIIFPISISTLRFKFVCVIGLMIWNGMDKIQSNLQKVCQNAFAELKKRQIKSIAIAEVSQQFGIPIQLACRIQSQQIYEHKDWIKIVTFLCNDNASQLYYIQNIPNRNTRLSKPLSQQSDKPVLSSKQSDYY